MNKTSTAVNLFLAAALLLSTSPPASAATDGVYALSETSFKWDGTGGNRLLTPTENYDYAYGDESSVSFTLPWQFPFYGQQYGSINVDTNGNIWFAAPGSAHSFDLPGDSRGPVISAWNSDLSSYFHGGVFVKRETDPERVVVEWQTETFTEEGYFKPNKLEVVLFTNGDIRFDYASFSTETGKDFGSGISQADGTHFLSVSSNYGNAYTLPGRSFLFRPDPGVPEGSIMINNGAASTNRRVVSLSLTCSAGSSSCAGMQFSRDSVTWTPLMPFRDTRSFTMNRGDGAKTVFVKFTSQTGATSEPISASIAYDTQPPTVTASVPSGRYTAPRSVALVASEPATIRYTLDDSTPTESSPIYSTPIDISMSTTLKYFAVDPARNKSAVVTTYYRISQPVLKKHRAPRLVKRLIRNLR